MDRGRRVVTVTVNPAIDQSIEIPNFSAGTVNRVRSSRLDAGGKGVNVASYLSDFGVPVTVTGFLGAENDAIFRRFFYQKALDDRFIRIPGETRTGIKVVDDARQETTDINFPGSPPDPNSVAALLELLSNLSQTSDWFVLSGSLPAGVSPDLYRQMIDALDGRFVALDTSGEALRLAIRGRPTLIKPNIDELGDLVGRTMGDPVEVARTALAVGREHGIARVIVSMGDRGAVFVAGQEAVWATPPPVTVRSTVGAGDAMVAGVVAGIIDGLSWEDCARLATAFSACAVGAIGSNLPPVASVRLLADNVEIRRLEL